MIPRMTLDILMRVRGLNQSALAKKISVSRRDVSLWFVGAPEDKIEIRGTHLRKLSRGLNISIEELVQPLPCLDKNSRQSMETELLWDNLYPDLVSFAIALVRGQPKALARLVQVFGLFRSAKMAGDVAWSSFPEYSRFIHPQRRADLERVWGFVWKRG